ncbi:MAG: hypothetical protein ABSH14_05620 [Verrucomicrobiia bacterium]|jgi:hypothetical protein
MQLVVIGRADPLSPNPPQLQELRRARGGDEVRPSTFTTVRLGSAVQGEIAGNDGSEDLDVLVTKGEGSLVGTLGTMNSAP